MEKSASIYVAGHRGLVGSALVRVLRAQGFNNLILKTHSELDLLDQAAVNNFFATTQIDYVFVAAAKVGGILFNNLYQADFLYENLIITANVIHASANSKVKKLLYLGSSCIYPKHAPQPIKEEYLLSGPLEPTNEGYALSKIAGLKLCEKYQVQYKKDFISAMPTNLYGVGDNFHPDHSHVIPGLLRRFHMAKVNKLPEVVIWGTGTPRREFLYVDDLAEALVVLMDRYSGLSTVNIGTGEDCTILQLAQLIKQVTGYPGKISTDPSKPDGTPRKVLDVTRMKSLGWAPRFSLAEGLEIAYKWALDSGAFEQNTSTH
ncbi:MAG: GDP-L-fucose synthase [Deltaproteobacteria bacterium]|nr:GDP-L-fucose synthase [Deltaproteobacteria bacterium]